MSFRRRHDPTAFLADVDGVVEAVVAATHGSSPRQVGAWMLVSAARTFGTIGGGALEHHVVAAARTMLVDGDSYRMVDLPLGPEIGQCCGGRVSVRLSALGDVARADLAAARRQALDALPLVYLFGAGHVGTALARALALAPVRPVLVDSRPDALSVPIAGVERRLSALPEAEARGVSADAAIVAATHDHALDFVIACEGLSRSDATYVGMIGSKTKRRRFESWFQKEAGGAPEALARLVCPIGAEASGAMDPAAAKRPEVIAATVAAEILTHLYPAPEA